MKTSQCQNILINGYIVMYTEITMYNGVTFCFEFWPEVK